VRDVATMFSVGVTLQRIEIKDSSAYVAMYDTRAETRLFDSDQKMTCAAVRRLGPHSAR